MASKKAGGSAKNLRDSNPKYLGLKLNDGQPAKSGNIIVRQRGTVFLAGQNVGQGKDHTLFATSDGQIKIDKIRHKRFDNTSKVKRIIHVLS